MKNFFTKFSLFVAGISLTHFVNAQCAATNVVGSSSNMFTQIRLGTNPVAVDKNLNTIVFIHRNNATAFGGSSGNFRYDISTNGGTTWNTDIGVLNPVLTNPGRYPNVTIYNPPLNVNPNNAFLGYMGATTNSATGAWNGVVSGVRQLTGGGNTENYNQPAGSNWLIPHSVVKGAPGVFWAVDAIYNGTVTTGFRAYKGVWNGSTDITWATNFTVTPNFNVGYDGTARSSDYNIAFDPTGTYGWISILTHLTPGPANYALYPVFYKTTDGGNTWSGPIQVDLNQLSCITANITGTNVATTNYEHDLVVDVNGNPHMFTTICNGTNTYALYYNNWHHMYDITTVNGIWTGYDVAAQSGGRGTWGVGSNSVTMDMQPQVARSADGKKIFFTWTDNSSYALGAANLQPNLFSRAFDVVQGKWTNVKDFTSCNGATNGLIYFPHIAEDVLEPTATSYKIASTYGEFTVGTDPIQIANFRFLNNLIYNNSDFTINQPTVAVNILQGSNWLLCPGNTLGMSITGSYSQVLWNNAATTNSTSTGVPGLFYVTVRNGCAIGIDSINVIGLNLNNPTASTSTVCTGKTSTLTATGNAYSYVWNPGAISGTTAVVSPTTTTIYTVTATGDACTYSKTITVSSTPGPTITVTGNNTVCSGSPVVQTASGANTYTWNTGPTTASISVTPTVNTTYTVNGTDINGCSNFAIANITVNANPTISVNSGSICSGNSFTMIPSGANTYTFQGGSAIVSPTTTTSYSVTGTSAAGCVSAAAAISSITVNPKPPVAISGPTTVCYGSSVTLTASGANSYAWYTGPVTATILVSPSVNTTYTVDGLSIAGCTNTAMFTLNVIPTPTVSISGTNYICSGTGGSVTLTSNGANTYTWSTTATTSSIIVSPTVTTSYTVTGAAANGCTSTAVQSVSIAPLPTVTISGLNSICFNTGTTLTALSGPANFTWSPGGQTSPSILISQTVTTTYTVVASDPNGCQNTAIKTVSVNPLPTVTANTSNSIICGPPYQGTATLNAGGALTYTWNPGGTGASIAVSPSVTSTYTLTGTDVNGCVNSTAITQSVSICANIKTLAFEEILNMKVYPNPTSGLVNLTYKMIWLGYEVYNSLGEKVSPPAITKKDGVEIDLSNFPSGMYFVKVRDGNFSETKKIIKE